MSAAEKVLAFHKALSDDGFPFFVNQMFSESVDILKDGKWVGGAYIDDISGWLQSNKKTIRVSARDHFKSMSFYALIMWKVLRLYKLKRSREAQYFSYKDTMSSYHLAKIKTAIACNPWFNGVIDLKTQAEGVISYSWDGDKRYTVAPKGMLEFKRGIHCPDIFVDDVLQDPENKLVPTKITRINDVMKSQIMDMAQDELHVVGTAQTNQDFFFDKAFTARFSVRILPAEKDSQNHIALWPEWMDWEELKAKERERGPKFYNQEYLVRPVYSENAFIEKKKLDEVINPQLKNYSVFEWAQLREARKKAKQRDDYDSVAGYDLGKKAHPSHFVIFEKRPVKIDGKEVMKRIQVHSKWFDQVDYQDQLAYIRQAIETFGVYRCYFDGTRGELEMMQESGELPPEMESVHFTVKSKHSMAAAIDKSISQKTIEFLNDDRQTNQMLMVTNDLQAPETPEGHGDSFWSIGLSHLDAEAEAVDIMFL